MPLSYTRLCLNNMNKKIVLLIILLTLPTLIPFFNNKFFYTQDHIFIARLHQMSTALHMGQFPVRWAPDLRYGEPLFNFYGPLPYYIGALIHFFGFNFIWVAKLLFILSAILSALSMYILAKELFGKKAGLLAAILYTYAPYRAVDIYVRGALSETWAFVFLPLIFYTSLKLSQKSNLKNSILLALSLAGLFLTHNVTALMFAPFLVLWWVYLIIWANNLKVIPYFAGSLLYSLSLSAFFLLPALWERGFIQTKYLLVGYFNFRAHFVAYKQLFSTFWGYGSSLWGPVDELSFQVGVVNWLIIGISIVIGFIYRKDKKLLFLISFLLLSFLLSIFLQHNKSAFVWEAIPLMAFIQFPWRFLAISIFIVSLVGAAITLYLKDKFRIIYVILIIASIFSTISYFRPKDYVEDSFFEKFLDKNLMHKGVDLTKDYLPIWVEEFETEVKNIPFTSRGQIDVRSFEKKGVVANSKIVVKEDSEIEFPLYYFPGWTAFTNGKNISLENPSELGLIRFKLPPGNYDLKFEFKNTPVRIIGNSLTLASILSALIFFKIRKKVI